MVYLHRALTGLLVLVVAANCGPALDRQLLPPDRLSSADKRSKYLKAHMRNGEAYVLRDWEILEQEKKVYGAGVRLGIDRDTLEQGQFMLVVDSVALFETNVKQSSAAYPLMMVLTIGSLAVTTVCIANPKACFGSCPTFYVDGDERPEAEGFSTSVAPSLEKTDIDALYNIRPPHETLAVTMRNEALETHYVRWVDLLAVPRGANERVFADSQGTFFAIANIAAPVSCVAEEGDCRELVKAFDSHERFSAADSVDLGAKEEITMKFARPVGDRLALILACRQTLLTTYLFYQTLAYMGTRAGEYLAALERGLPGSRAGTLAIGTVLGGIDVYINRTDSTPLYCGYYRETGPLATDCRAIPLPDVDGDTLQITLRLTRGLWRLNWAVIGSIQDTASPVRLHPGRVVTDVQSEDTALDLLLDRERYLVTNPGEDYCLFYPLPENSASYDYFLEARGYYMEWMREEWLAEENTARALEMLISPKQALKNLAPEYKAMESEMEQMFWSSRYAP